MPSEGAARELRDLGWPPVPLDQVALAAVDTLGWPSSPPGPLWTFVMDTTSVSYPDPPSLRCHAENPAMIWAGDHGLLHDPLGSSPLTCAEFAWGSGPPLTQVVSSSAPS